MCGSSLDPVCDYAGITDPAVSLRKELSPALGSGFRLGFLGMLHMDVFAQRLSQVSPRRAAASCCVHCILEMDNMPNQT